jgi:TonB-linked SusC/RagA family outer membrane protein
MKLKIYLLLLACFCTAFAWSQTRQITGRVVADSSNQPLTGVNVSVKGTSTTVATDANGQFSLTIPNRNNVVLTVSSVGYATQDVAVGDRSVVNVTLSALVSALNDVVVVGYQTVRRRDLTGSVSSVSAKQLKDIPVNSAAQALAGRLAGVQITGTEGSPDAQVLIRVRGGGSITQDFQPIYIVDGVQVENALSVISPQDIESIDVLKDASTTAIYGARGANGVVIITTKGGRTGKPVITYNGLVGVKQLANKLDLMSPYEFVLYQYERSRGSSQQETDFQNNYGRFEDIDLYNSVPGVDWQQQMFGRNAMMQTHNASLSGGDKATQYNLSLTYNMEEGIMQSSDFDRKLVNFKLDHTFSPKLKVGFTTRYNNTVVNGAGTSNPGSSATNNLRQAIKYKPILQPGEGLYSYDQEYADLTNANSLRLVNPILLNQAQYRRDLRDVFNATGYLNFTINKYLSFRSTLGYNLDSRQQREFDDSLTYNSVRNYELPIAEIDNSKRFTIDNSNVLTFTLDKSGTSFSKNNKVTLLLGQETYLDRITGLDVVSRYFPNGITPERAFANMDLPTPPTGETQPKPSSNDVTAKLASFFGRLNYAYSDRYLLTLSFRADGSTKFIPGNRWSYFPSGTFAWRVSREKFFDNVDFINDLKLRVGYGEAGNNRIGNFLYISTFGTGADYYLNNQPVTAYTSAGLANAGLVWENNISRNIGLDVSFLHNRIQFTTDVYKNSSKNLLTYVAVPASSGYTRQIQNVGSLYNSGVEFQVNAAVVQHRDFSWSANFNASYNTNKITSLGANQTSYLETSGWAGSNVPSDYIVKVGESVGSVWGLVNDGYWQVSDFDYDPATGNYTLKSGLATNTNFPPQPGVIKFKDLNGDGVIDDNDRTIIGHTLPKWVGGLNQQFQYKNFDLSVFFNFQFGNDVYNANKLEFSSGYTPNSNLLAIMNSDKRWRTVDANGNVVTDPTELQKLNANATIWKPITSAQSFYAQSWAIENGGFVRLNNVTLGYTLPKSVLSRAGIQTARIYVTGNNLAVFTNYSGYDPEVGTRNSSGVTPGVDYSAYPRSRNYIVGLNLSF